jgi:hypothetical protein
MSQFPTKGAAGELAEVITEYVVGFVPEEGNGTPKKYQLEVKMTSNNGVRVSGGNRTIVH